EKLPPLLRRWRDGILGSADNAQGLKRYPGSPLQVARLLRPGDSAQLCELHTEAACKLRDLFRGNPQVHVHERDGYEALKALVPPQEKRGLVLIDPPYEAQDAEYKLIEQALKPALQRWPTGVYAVWYPIKLRSQVQPFLRRLQHSGVKRVLRAELLVHPDDSPLRLNGSGMVILNAPWKLDDALREPLPSRPRLSRPPRSHDHAPPPRPPADPARPARRLARAGRLRTRAELQDHRQRGARHPRASGADARAVQRQRSHLGRAHRARQQLPGPQRNRAAGLPAGFLAAAEGE